MSDYGLTPGERERIALALGDALMPYGRDFNPEDAARLLEARLSMLLGEARDDGYARGHADGRLVGRAEVERERPC